MIFKTNQYVIAFTNFVHIWTNLSSVKKRRDLMLEKWLVNLPLLFLHGLFCLLLPEIPKSRNIESLLKRILLGCCVHCKLLVFINYTTTTWFFSFLSKAGRICWRKISPYANKDCNSYYLWTWFEYKILLDSFKATNIIFLRINI